jgi:hypothetical protein
MSFDANKNMITAAFITQFHDSFEIAAQQKDSRLQAAVHDRGMITGEAFTINDMGTIEMTQITTRFGDTVWDLPEAGTRNALMADYAYSCRLKNVTCANCWPTRRGHICSSPWRPPTAKKTMLFIARCSTRMRKTSNNGAYASVALPASQKIVAGGTGMTKAKLIAAKAMFRRNECDEQNGEELYMTYNADMLTQILSDTTLTSPTLWR